MTQWRETTDDPQWQEAQGDHRGPFANVGPVDPLVFVADDQDPELRVDRVIEPPPPPTRQAPKPPSRQNVAPWSPGAPIDPNSYRPKPARVNPLRALLVTLVPLGVIVGVIYGVMQVYGL